MISLEEYLKDPCGTLSIPFWKQEKIVIPNHMQILHDQEFSNIILKEYNDEPYFRLVHSLKNVKKTYVNTVQILFGVSNLNDFVQCINACYTDIEVTQEDLENCCKTRVFYPDLWLLVKDIETGKIIGSGIADFDKEIGEVILEWIQVLPEYRGRGFGQLIVNTLLEKMQGIAKFATVSGKVNNPTKPEILYRKCGFTGNDIWHILTKKI